MKVNRRAWNLGAAGAAGVGLAMIAAAMPASANGYESDDPVIKTLSARPFAVSGGDVVLEVAAPRHLRVRDLIVRLNGKDVTGQFSGDGKSARLTGLITGLKLGENVVTVSAPHQHRNVHYGSLKITNHPTSGEIFAPHQRPWICETATAGLGAPPASGPCAAETRFDWFYRTTAGTFQPLPSGPLPADLAQTTTIDGKTVSYIVRVESGVINESIYRIAILDDPAAPISNPWSSNGKKPGAGWNGKLTWPFGGGCGPAYRSGSNTPQNALSHTPLSLGFAVAFGTRNTLGTGCNDVVSAETLMMIKERFVEQYGLPKFTIGSGGSGGAMQQRLITQNYPGLLDAITPGISYADLVSILPDVADCGLLNNYFDANAGAWPASRRALIDGYPVNEAGTNTTCRSWNGFARSWTSSTLGFNAAVPVELRYDPVTNPAGARGSFWDGNVESFGRDRDTGFALSAYDNVGVQYGLKALNAGTITVDDFLDLNEKMGGFDFDGNLVAARSEASRKALRNTYRHGRLISGENQIVPTIDTRNYTDLIIDIHTRIRTFAMLERLKKENGTTANQVNWLVPNNTVGNLPELALRAHNEWLERILADDSRGSYRQKVIRNRPSWVKDACWLADGTKHEEKFTLDPDAVCNKAYPIYSTVRLEAGSKLSSDVMKCQLKRVDFRQYNVSFSVAQRERMKAIFPDGVCDWSKRGVEQHPIKGTWLEYPRAGHAVSLEDEGEGHHHGHHHH